MSNGITDIFTRDHAALAPLAGVSNSVYRRICRSFGARPVMTEMVSSEGLVRGGGAGKSARLLEFRKDERPIGFQLFGADPGVMREAARMVAELGPDFVDINAGCPVKKVVARGAGSALLRNPELLGMIVEEVVAVSPVPVTVKIRSGWDRESVNAVKVARVCEDAGAQALIVHPRTRAQGFSGDADWSIIRAVKNAVAIPVVGSGDVFTPDDAVAMMDETGADAVMIGRGALGNPWIFKQVRERLRGGAVSAPPDTAERLGLALRQLEILAGEVSERFAVLNMRKFFGWYSKGMRDGAVFRRRVFRAETMDEVRNIVRDFQARSAESEDFREKKGEMAKP